MIVFLKKSIDVKKEKKKLKTKLKNVSFTKVKIVREYVNTP